jgi:hypothetical protein
VLEADKSLAPSSSERKTKAQISYLTSGDPAALESLLPQLVGETGVVRSIQWQDGRLIDRAENLSK